MTPKEKAIELVEKFGIYVSENYYAKKYALIAVEEIRQSLRYTNARRDLGYIGYWTQVKQEIEKL
jgi:hypothetical protein